MSVAISPSRGRRGDGATVLVAGLVISVLLWLVPGASLVLMPLHPYLTFVHEGWHALIGVLTGAHVRAVHVMVTGGGVTLMSGGWLLPIASAGYVGSAVTGATFLSLLARPGALRVALFVQYAWLVIMAALWDHDLSAWLYLGFFGLVLYLLAARLPERWFAMAMGFMALQLALAVLGDLQTLLRISLYSTAHSDALVASQATHLPSLLWAALWALCSGLLLLWAVKATLLPAVARRRAFDL